MTTPSAWLDARSARTGSGRNVPALFVAPDEDAPGRVLVQFGDELAEVSVPGSGLLTPGDIVTVQLAEDGSPVGLIEGGGSEPVEGGQVAVGSTARYAQRAWVGADAARERAEAAQAEADRIRSEFDPFVEGTNEELGRLQGAAKAVAAELEAEKARVTQALDKAFEVEGGVQGALSAVSNLDTDLRPKITAAQASADSAGAAAGEAHSEALAAIDKASAVEVAASEALSAATDAATAASGAQAKANEAFTNAATAKQTADQAVANAALAQSKADTADAKATTANGRVTIAAANPTAADAVGKPIGALWEVRAGSTVLRRFVLTAASTWTQVKAGQDFIGDKAIGQAQIGDAAVGTAQIADLTVTNAKMGNISAGKIDASLGAFTNATITSLVGDSAFFNALKSKKVVVAGDPTNKVGSILLENGAVTAPKITASQELSAKVAEFLELKTSKLVWDTAAGNSAWITSLVGDSAFFNSLYANRLLVTGGNLLQNASFQGDVWTRNSGTQSVVLAPITTPAGRPATVTATGASTTYAAYYAYNVPEARIPCDGNTDSYVASALVYSETAIPASGVGFFAIRWDANGARSTASKGWPTVIPAQTWTRIEVELPLVAATRSFGICLYANSATPQEVYFGEPSVVRKTGSVYIENGAVGADTLAAKINLSSKFVAGPEAGAHAELDQTGFHAFRKVAASEGGGVAEVVSLGVDGSSDYLSVSDASGRTLSSLDDVGGGNFRAVNSDVGEFEDLYIAGQHISELLWNTAWGQVARGSVKVPGGRTVNAPNAVTFAELKFVGLPGRTYRISALGPTVFVTGAGTSVRLIVDNENTNPDNRYDWLGAGNQRANGSRYWVCEGEEREVTVKYAVGVSAGSYQTNATYRDLDLLVEDVGPSLDNSATVAASSGDAPPAAVKKTYTKTYNATWYGSYYRDSGALSSSMRYRACQGSYSGSAANNLKGAIGFPDITSVLSGATVKKIEVYVYFEHWYWNAGGQARVGVHTALNKPSTMSGGTALVSSKTIPKPGGAWVTLPSSVHAGFKSGAYRGILLYAASNSVADYGYTPTSGSSCKLRITYEK